MGRAYKKEGDEIMKIDVDEIIVGERYRQQVGDLTSLKESMEAVGLLHPIVVTETPEGKYKLIAGLRRLEAWKVTGLKMVECHVIIIQDLRRAEIDENQVREDFTFKDKFAIIDAYEDDFSQEAKQRMVDAHASSGKLPELEKGETRTKMAKLLNVSEKTYDKIKTIKNSGIKKWIDRVHGGTTSIDYAFRMVTKTQAETERIPLPDGEFDIIYADPPWEYDLQLSGAPNYPTMPVNEICDLVIPSGEDAVLFLWTTGPKIEEAFRVINAWGFTYKTFHIWAKINAEGKVQRGTGYYFAGVCEILLLATKGKPGTPLPENVPLGLHQEGKRKHSEKPDYYYQMIEKMYPSRKYLELFARKIRDGWTSWGNQLGEEAES